MMTVKDVTVLVDLHGITHALPLDRLFQRLELFTAERRKPIGKRRFQFH